MVLSELVGNKLECVQFDSYSPYLLFGEKRDIHFRIERSFYIQSDNKKIEVDFSVPLSSHAGRMSGTDELVNLVYGEVIKAVADEDGSISIEFESGSSLKVEPLDEGEAWTLTDSEGVLVSLPGGGLG